MYRLATKHTEKKNRRHFGKWTPPAHAILTKLASPQRYRRELEVQPQRQAGGSVLQL